MTTFVSVNDDLLGRCILAAKRRVVFIAPGVSKPVADVIRVRLEEDASLDLTVILDGEEDPYRIGYGDAEGLAVLYDLAAAGRLKPRVQAGLRIGLLIADDEVILWAPTAKAVETPREEDQPNGLSLRGRTAAGLERAVAAAGEDLAPEEAELGRLELSEHTMKRVLKALRENPPAPFDLSRRTRVFSTRFQFVEFERRGVGWSTREFNASSHLNLDVPKSLRKILDTRIKPFAQLEDLSVKVQRRIDGEPAFDASGRPFFVETTEADIEKEWRGITDEYLYKLAGFGWIVEQARKAQFQERVERFEATLHDWTEEVRRALRSRKAQIAEQVVAVVRERAARAESLREPEVDRAARVAGDAFEAEFGRLDSVESSVRLVFKNVAWESTEDAEFERVLRKAVPASKLEGWFETFSVVRAREDG